MALITTLTHCVACGQRLTDYDHKCDPKRLQHIEARRSAAGERYIRTNPFWERLKDGFAMLNEDYGS